MRYGLRGWSIDMGGAFFSDGVINKGGAFQMTTVKGWKCRVLVGGTR